MYQGNSLLHVQNRIANEVYRSRTGELRSTTSISLTSTNGDMNIKYPLHIRFLDLKRTINDKKKRIYEPIYNKYVYGFLYIGIYNALAKGLSIKIKVSLIKSMNDAE